MATQYKTVTDEDLENVSRLVVGKTLLFMSFENEIVYIHFTDGFIIELSVMCLQNIVLSHA